MHAALPMRTLHRLNRCIAVVAILLAPLWSQRVSAQCDTPASFLSRGIFDNHGARWASLSVGRVDTNTVQRGYLAVRLPRFSAPPQSAWLEFYIDEVQSPFPTEVMRVREVLSPPLQVYGTVTNAAVIYEDLGDGLVYGSQVLTNQVGTFAMRLDLNADALSALAPRAGSEFVLGIELPDAEADATRRLVSISLPALHLGFSSAGPPVVCDSSVEVASALTNAPANLWVRPCGRDPLQLQWYREGEPVSAATNEWLTLTVTNGLPGLYWAVIQNGLGSATSAVTRVLINETLPSIYQQPSSAYVMAGSSVWLGAGVQGVPFPSLQWFWNGQPLRGETNSALVLTDCRPEQSGRYWLVASNHAGTCITEVAVVTIDPLQVGIYGGTPSPGSVFYLFSSTYGLAPAGAYQWRLNGAELPGATAPALTLTNLATAHQGTYDLVACNAYGCSTSAGWNVTLLPCVPSIWSLDAKPEITAGEDLVIGSDVVGAQPLSRQWFFAGSALNAETNETLIIPSATTNTSGVYTLLVTNVCGASTSSVIVSVTARPPEPSGSQSAEMFGRSILLEYPRSLATFRWTHNDQELADQTNHFLFLKNLSTTDEGRYFVTVSNPYGTVTGSCGVTVLPRRALEHWTWRAPSPQGNDLHDLAFGNGRYVASGDEGEIIWSSNAVQWFRTPLQFAARPMEFSEGQFFVAGWRWYGWVPQVGFLSSDGLEWHARELSPQEVRRRGAVLGRGVYTIGTSSSLDGVHWRPSAPVDFARIAYGNGRFVGLAYGLSTAIWTSTDGTAWFAGQVLQAPLRALAFGNGIFIAAGEDGFVFTSTDGFNWTGRGRVVSRDINDVIFDGAQFVACGNRGLVSTSSDGLAWAVRAGELEDLFGVVFARDRFVAVGDQGTVLVSRDGSAWDAQFSGTSRDLHGICWGNGLFVAVGRKGTVLTSPDGVNWTVRPTGSGTYLERVCYGNGEFLAVGNTPPAILTSASGLTWQAADLSPLTLNPATRLEGCAAGPGLFVVVGGYFNNPVAERGAIPQLLVSVDGTTWQRRSAPVYGTDGVILRNVTYGQGRFVIVANDGRVFWSANANSWSGAVAWGQNLRSVLYHDATSRFVAVGNSGSVVSASARAELLWNCHQTHIAQNLHDVAFGLNTYVAVGNGGTIVQSDCATPLLVPSLLSFDIRGGIEPEYELENSDDLRSWMPCGVYTNVGPDLVFEISAHGGPHFYRARSSSEPQ